MRKDEGEVEIPSPLSPSVASQVTAYVTQDTADTRIAISNDGLLCSFCGSRLCNSGYDGRRKSVHNERGGAPLLYIYS